MKRFDHTLQSCPGMVGYHAPAGPGCIGKVIVDPSYIVEANRYLRRRFHVNENLSLSHDQGIVLEIVARASPCRTGERKVKVHFQKPVQYELTLT